MQAVRLHQQGWSARKIGRHLGYHHTAVMKWVRKAARMRHNKHLIPTASSQPKRHPRSLPNEVVRAIIEERLRTKRCAEVIHQQVLERGIQVSLSSVKRTLKRHHLLKERSPWKRRHDSTPRPNVLKPGDLVQIDTIHIVLPQRFYVYTLLDVYTRWAHAAVSKRITTHDTLRFMQDVKNCIPFEIAMLQSDHGSEFSTYFSEHVQLDHRHSRVRTPNDNAHLERFNRTVQEECLDHVAATPRRYQAALDTYLPYYNNERKHLSLNLKTPQQWCQGVDR
jgi:transposase InsO family protein